MAKFFGTGTVRLNLPINSTKRKSVSRDFEESCKFLINPQLQCQFFHVYIAKFSIFRM